MKNFFLKTVSNFLVGQNVESLNKNSTKQELGTSLIFSHTKFPVSIQFQEFLKKKPHNISNVLEMNKNNLNFFSN